jgi:hypothetical protein
MFSTSSQGQPHTPEVEAWIAAEPSGAGHFAGYIRASEDFAGRYEVIAERRSATGTSKVRQAGAVNAQKQVALRVSHVSLGTVSPTDHVVVTLNVYSGDRLVVTRQFGS